MDIPEFTLDADGYPSDATLDAISKAAVKSLSDCEQLLCAIKAIWEYADVGYWSHSDGKYELSTGGWSGNESIISALEQNFVFWALFWESSKRGGHYVFRARP